MGSQDAESPRGRPFGDEAYGYPSATLLQHVVAIAIGMLVLAAIIVFGGKTALQVTATVGVAAFVVLGLFLWRKDEQVQGDPTRRARLRTRECEVEADPDTALAMLRRAIVAVDDVQMDEDQTTARELLATRRGTYWRAVQRIRGRIVQSRASPSRVIVEAWIPLQTVMIDFGACRKTVDEVVARFRECSAP